MFQNTDNTAFRPFPVIFLLDDNLHLIAMHGAARPVTGNEDILFSAFYRHKAKSLGVAGKNARQGKCFRPAEFSFRGQADLAFL